jgi:hypothetical protein
MICDIIERVNIKKVDKCLASDLHIDPAYIILHPNTERLLCHTLHIRGPRYNKSFYAIDMIWSMATQPTRARYYWSEFISEMRRK